MPAFTRQRWTGAQVRALIEASPEPSPRYELVDGELLVTPSPGGPHQKVIRRLLVALDAYLAVNRVGEVLTSPFDVELEAETIVQPDVFVVSREEAARLETDMPGRILTLVVEVLSPTTAYADRGPKRRLYQRHVPEYWIVDVDARLVERWRAGDERPEILSERIDWAPQGAALPFTMSLIALFGAPGPDRHP